MAYCTKAEVKLYLDIRETEVEKDALIEALIISSQAFIDEYCNRVFEQAAVTEYHDGGSNRIFLDRYPIASSPAVQIWDSWDRAYASTDLIDTDDYFVDSENGIIKFDYDVGGSAIQQFQPKYILLFGAKAVEAFFMNRTQPISTNLSIGRWRKLCIPDVQTKAWVIPLYHPSFVIRNPDAENIFKLDLQWAMEQITSNLPEIEEIDYSQKIKCLTNTDEILDILKTIKEQKPTIAFDYETTGLRPYYPGHSIVSTAVAIYGEDIAYAWPYSYPGAWQSGQLEALNKAWRGVLSDPEILK